MCSQCLGNTSYASTGSKCSFGVSSGKFLVYMITHRGIEVNLDQIKAINDLHLSRNPKEVQS